MLTQTIWLSSYRGRWFDLENSRRPCYYYESESESSQQLGRLTCKATFTPFPFFYFTSLAHSILLIDFFNPSTQAYLSYYCLSSFWLPTNLCWRSTIPCTSLMSGFIHAHAVSVGGNCSFFRFCLPLFFRILLCCSLPMMKQRHCRLIARIIFFVCATLCCQPATGSSVTNGHLPPSPLPLL